MSHAGILRGIIENAETDVTVPDPMTVVIRLKTPSLILPNYLSRQLGNEGMIIPKKYIEKIGIDAFAANPIGSGPYKFLERQLGSYIKYEAVGQHWNVGIPKYKTMTIYFVNEESTRIAMLKTKQVDLIEISRDKAKEVPGYDIYEKKDALIVGLFGDQLWDKTTFMSNEKFRTALSISINRKEIQDFVFAGRGTVVGAGPSYGSFALDYKPFPLIPYDPGRAAQLVKEAYPGQTPAIAINTDPGALPENLRLAEAVAGYWRKVGIDVKITPTEHATWGALAQKKDQRLRNTTYLYRQGNRLLWDGSFEALYHSKGRYTSVMDPQLDALIDALPKSRDAETLGKQMREVAAYLQEHFIQIPLITVGDLFAVDPKKITQWPNVSSPMAYDLFLDDLFIRK
jgi:peptide/nickel transport system substrate-binding protein